MRILFSLCLLAALAFAQPAENEKKSALAAPFSRSSRASSSASRDPPEHQEHYSNKYNDLVYNQQALPKARKEQSAVSRARTTALAATAAVGALGTAGMMVGMHGAFHDGRKSRAIAYGVLSAVPIGGSAYAAVKANSYYMPKLVQADKMVEHHADQAHLLAEHFRSRSMIEQTGRTQSHGASSSGSGRLNNEDVKSTDSSRTPSPTRTGPEEV